MNKKIHLELPGRIHSYFLTLIRYPPEGYTFVVEETIWEKLLRPLISNDFLYFGLRNFRDSRLMPPLHLLISILGSTNTSPQDNALTYSWNHLIFREEPWVLDFERIYSLTNWNIRDFKRYKKFIERALNSNYCKKILYWNELVRKDVVNMLDSKGFSNKLELVHRAVPPKDFIKCYNQDKKIKLLFVGTRNDVGAFEPKGGKEVLESFIRLRKKYSNVQLVIRSDIPRNLKQRVAGFPGIKIMEEIVSWSTLVHEFKSTDIFLFPTHITPCTVFLDAMSYELPIVTINEDANSEIVEDGKTGFVVRKSKYIPDYDFTIEGAARNQERWKKATQMPDPDVVRELVEKTSILIEDEELRKRMGKAGRKEIEEGRFSIRRRNKKLRKIFDEAISE